MKTKIVSAIVCATLLAACANNTQDNKRPDMDELGNSGEITKVNDVVGEKCNQKPADASFVINSPCPGEMTTTGKLMIRGKISKSFDEISVRILEDTNEIANQKIFAEPTTAASDEKIIQSEITLPSDAKGLIEIVFDNGASTLKYELKPSEMTPTDSDLM